MSLVAAIAAALAVWLLAPTPPAVRATWEGAARWVRGGLLGSLCLLVVPARWAAPGAVLAAAAAGGFLLWRRQCAARLAGRTAELLAEACDLLASELAAGRPADLALAEAAEAWPAIRAAAESCRLGGDVPAVLRLAAEAPGAGGLRQLAAAWAVSHRTGSGLAPATRRVAESVRRDQSTRRVVAGELASARATARLVAGLPLVALLMGSGAGADPWSFLLGTPAGLACLSSGLAAGLGGLWWIEAIAAEMDR